MNNPEKNTITRVSHASGMPAMCLSHFSGYECTVLLYGAHLVSWKDPRDQELLYMSENAVLAKGTPIRGGIPLVFPQFGKGVLPSHGFARTSEWRVVREHISAEGTVMVALRLTPDDVILSQWPHACTVELEIVLGETLTTILRVENTDVRPLEFFDAFHSYFRVGDITSVRVLGLEGCGYVDFLLNREQCSGVDVPFVIDRGVDRAYQGVSKRVIVEAPALGHRIAIEREEMPDTVVWNPWIETSKGIKDLPADGYTRFLCVECGNVLSPVVLGCGEKHSSKQVLRRLD